LNSEIRLKTSEKLDNLELSGVPLKSTLNSLRFINLIFGNRRQLCNAVLQYCLKHPEQKHFHIVDLGCGGGDCIHYLSKKLKKHNISASFVGIDGNPESVAIASSQSYKTEQTKFITANILTDDFVVPTCDLLISSHFIYHFSDDKLTDFLSKLQPTMVKYVVLSELLRSKTSYYLFKCFGVLLPISKMAKSDGLLAIQRAFSIKELKAILQKSNPNHWKINKKPWFRVIITVEL